MTKRLAIKMNGPRHVVGRLSGFDVFMNLVVEEAEEVRVPSGASASAAAAGSGGERIPIGVMIIRGNSIIELQCLDPVS